MSLHEAFEELEHRLEVHIKELDKILKYKDGSDVGYWEMVGERGGLRIAFAEFLKTKKRWL